MGYFSVRSLLALGLFSSTIAKPIYKRQDNGSMIYDFSEITPSLDLQWVPCYDNFTCTVLVVPLDYDDTAAGTTNLAFMKWSAQPKNSTNSSSVQDILVNPGGPGAGGAFYLESALERLLEVLGTENNLIGFDPRGTGNSGPLTSCFPGKGQTNRLYNDEFWSPVDAKSTKSVLETYANSAAFGEWCTEVHSAPNSSVKYVNTVATAGDMLHYTKKLAESKGEDPEKSQLWYYGVSYGTVLGTAYAALFPDRVGRLILDGVVNGKDYWDGAWKANLVDADETFETFFKYCYEAGEGGACSFWAESPEAIKARYDAIVKDIEENPIVVTDKNYVSTPAVATIEAFKNLQLQIPYAPIDLFPIFADILIELEKRNGGGIIAFSGVGRAQDGCVTPPVNSNFGNPEPRQFIACIDGNGRYNLSTVALWKEHVDLLVKQSKYLGESWAAGTAVNCHKLDIKAPPNQIMKNVPSADKTSQPILFLSSTLDPVTPLRAAKEMNKRFGGSRLLVQDNEGHAAISAPSDCTNDYVHKYLKDASLPAEGTVCNPNFVPFKGTTNMPSMLVPPTLVGNPRMKNLLNYLR